MEQQNYFAELQVESDGFKKLLKERDHMIHLQTWKTKSISLLSALSQTLLFFALRFCFVDAAICFVHTFDYRRFPRIQSLSPCSTLRSRLPTHPSHANHLRLCFVAIDRRGTKEFPRSREFAGERPIEEADGADESCVPVSRVARRIGENARRSGH